MPDGDLFEQCSEIADQLDESERRLARPAGEFGHSDALRLDHIALHLDDLKARQRWSERDGQSVEERRGLADLYMSPLGDPAGSMLDALIDRAALLREQAWLRVGVPLPHDPPMAGANAGPVEGVIELAPAPEAPIARRIAPAPTAERTGPDAWRIVTEILTAVGVLALLLVIHVVYATGLFAAHSQRDLSREFDTDLRSAVAAADARASEEIAPSGEPADGSTMDAGAYPTLPEPGDPVALLSMPTIGARDVVVEGTTAKRLTAGPGHLRSTPMPGRPGNAVVFGRRTTYGGPFEQLDDLRPGDPVEVTTADGLFRYIVQSVDRIGPGEPDPIGTTFSNRLTLVTADERFSASGRLVAVALLDGQPVAPPMTSDGRPLPLPTVGDAELGTQRTGTDWALLLVWTQVLVAVYLGARWLFHHWLPWSTWLVSAPIVLVVAFAWLDSVALLLPSTL